MKKSLVFTFSVLVSLGWSAISASTVDLQGTVFNADTVAHFPIGPGVTQTQIVFSSGSRTVKAFLVDMDVEKGKGVRVKVDVGRDSCNTAEAITSIAKRKTDEATQYLAGINGDFFITSAFAAQHEFGNAILGYPNMACATQGKIVAPDMIDITSRENALIVGKDGMWIDATDLRYQITDEAGKTVVNATAINYPRRDNEMVLYNRYMGNYTKTSAQGRELILRPAEGAEWSINAPVKFVVDGEWHAGQSLIPAEGLVISCGPKYSNPFIDGLKPGDTVTLNIELSLPAFDNIKPAVSEVCGGDVRILKENVTTTEAIRWINTPSAQYSRSLVGYSKDRKHVVLCAVDAGGGSSGVTYYEAADLMRFLGCHDALDLDGGGSTAIWTHSHGIFNNLRDGSERAVGNGLFFVLDAPADPEVKSIGFADYNITLPQYALYRPVIYGYNEYGQLVEKGVGDFRIETNPDLGETQADGMSILITGQGTHLLNVACGEMKDTLKINVTESSDIRARHGSYLLDGYHPRTLELVTDVNNTTMNVSPLALTWTSADESVMTVDASGVMTGLANGTTVITGTLNDTRIEIPVTVEKPASSDIPVFGSWITDEWEIKRASVSTATAVVNPETAGMDITYKVSSTRGPRVTLANTKKIYSCPDGLSVTFGQNGIPVTALTATLKAANATRDVSLTADAAQLPAAGEIKTVRFNLSDAFDIDDPAIYPIEFVSLAFTPPAKADEFTFNLRDISGCYSYVEDSVDDVAMPSGNSDKLLFKVENSVLTLPFTAENVEIFTPTGVLVKNEQNTSSVTMVAKGFYIIRATYRGKTLSASAVFQ